MYNIKLYFTLFILSLLVFLLPGSLWSQDLDTGNQTENAPAVETVRFGFTQAVLGTVNENDAAAAVRSWTQNLTHEMDIPADPAVRIYAHSQEVKKELENKQVDVLYMTTSQWFDLRLFLSREGMLAVEQSGGITDTYFVLVHKDRGFNKIEDLKDSHLNVLENGRTCLARNWLAQFLGKKGLKLNGFFKEIKLEKKINKAVLPVFFKQTDACLVTQEGFETMAELNPQISRQLKVLVQSQPYVPMVFSFRKDYKSPLKSLFLNSIQQMTRSSSGHQLLTIFQMAGLRQIAVEDLADSCTLLEQYKGENNW